MLNEIFFSRKFHVDYSEEKYRLEQKPDGFEKKSYFRKCTLIVRFHQVNWKVLKRRPLRKIRRFQLFLHQLLKEFTSSNGVLFIIYIMNPEQDWAS